MLKMQENNEYLFDAKILDEIRDTFVPIINSTLDSIIIRPLHIDDFNKGYINLLSQLTKVGNIDEQNFKDTFRIMQKSPDTYYITIIEDKNSEEIIGTTTLLMEQKFIHDCGKRGRIEDVVVSDKFRGKQFGKLLLNIGVDLAKKLECYKISLDCRDQMIPFYESIGFKKEPENGNFMTIRFRN